MGGECVAHTRGGERRRDRALRTQSASTSSRCSSTCETRPPRSASSAATTRVFRDAVSVPPPSVTRRLSNADQNGIKESAKLTKRVDAARDEVAGRRRARPAPQVRPVRAVARRRGARAAGRRRVRDCSSSCRAASTRSRVNERQRVPGRRPPQRRRRAVGAHAVGRRDVPGVARARARARRPARPTSPPTARPGSSRSSSTRASARSTPTRSTRSRARSRTSAAATAWSASSPTCRELAERMPVRYRVSKGAAHRRRSTRSPTREVHGRSVGRRVRHVGRELERRADGRRSNVDVEVPADEWRRARRAAHRRAAETHPVRRRRAPHRRAGVDRRRRRRAPGHLRVVRRRCGCGATAGRGRRTSTSAAGCSAPRRAPPTSSPPRRLPGAHGRVDRHRRTVLAVQERMTDVEVDAARHTADDRADLVVVDGPLRGRTHIDRAVGVIKTHDVAYLPAELHRVGRRARGRRAHAGVHDRVDLEPALVVPAAPRAARRRGRGSCGASARPTSPPPRRSRWRRRPRRCCRRFATEPHKDTRAPQNLYPIGGLERELRHRLGDQALLFRSLLRVAAT